jgi:hypothetical protein
MKHFVIGVDWYGPYLSRDQAIAAAEAFPVGLYFALGRTRYGRTHKPQYVGISKNLGSRLKHHLTLDKLRGTETLWLGYISTAEQSGRSFKATPRTLDEAEWCHAFFMDLPLNEKKTVTPPQRNVTVLNRWWTVDERPRDSRPHKDWPDLFDFMGIDRRSRVVWFGGRQAIHNLHKEDI